jgi:hypothetical protein
MNTARTLGNVNNKVEVCVVIIVRTTSDFHIGATLPDLIYIYLEIFECRHDGELYNTFCAE